MDKAKTVDAIGKLILVVILSFVANRWYAWRQMAEQKIMDLEKRVERLEKP